MPVRSTRSPSRESLKNDAAIGGTSTSQSPSTASASKSRGMKNANITRYENFAPLRTSSKLYSLSPYAHDLVICGLMAVRKLETNCLAMFSIWAATPLAALTVTPKKTFTTRLTPCVLNT